MEKIKKLFKNGIFSPEKNVSNLQMSLTLLLVICLVLSNIIVVKSIDLFGNPNLANTCAILTFPITYVLSDVFSEVYGYKWSRVTATWAFIGTLLCSMLFALSIAIPGNSAWNSQDQLISILGSTPQIAFTSILAYWVGDFVNDKVFQLMKEKNKTGKMFGLRAIVSSIAGKYVDGAIFTFLGLSFLPFDTKIIMILNCPFIQVCLETMLLPITTLVMKKVKKAEERLKRGD